MEVGVDLSAMTQAQGTAFATSVGGIYSDLTSLIEDPDGFAAHIPEALEHVRSLTDAMAGLDLILPAPADIARKLFDYLVFIYVQRKASTLQSVLVFFGVFSAQEIPPAGGLPRYVKREVHWDVIPKLLKPEDRLRDLYHWGDPNLDSNLLLARLEPILWSLGLPSSYTGGPSPGTDGVLGLFLVVGLGPVTAGLGVETSYLAAAGASPPGLSLVPAGLVEASQTIPAGGGWEIGIKLHAAASAGYGVSIRPGGTVTLGPIPGQPPVSWKLGTDLSVSRTGVTGQRATIFGPPDGARFEAGSIGVTLHVETETNDGDIGLELAVVDGQVVIAAGKDDGFLAKVLPADGIAVEFDFTLGWSAKHGLYFRGSGGIETTLPVQLNLGPLRIPSVYLRLRLRADGKLGITVAASPSLDIGVLVASVDRIGIELAADLGPSPHLDVLFNPPTGVGILVDAGPVTGGGFLSFDYDAGRYSGVMQLQIYSVAITAIGLLDTKLPGGQPGYSFLIIITAKFPPIQLGFGFTLNGAGGLAGINRTVVVDALQAGVRSGAIDYLLFPENPVRDAAIIISDLRTFFPPAEGRYVFGPIALIGWGTPTLISAELGIVLEVPSPVRLLLLGQVSALLPDPDAAIVVLHLDILGVIDFEAKLLSIDATLRDSRVAVYTISGDMAMRLSWGEKPNFALAVGGWNPHFQPPSGFPELRRVTVALGTGDNPRITLQGYFAVTSNSAQVGASAELYAEAAGFNVHGWVGFDAIFIFTPFSFRTDISAGVAFRRGNSTMATVHLDATLTGPSPFHAWGEACLSLLFFDACVPFDATFGPTQQIEPPARDPWDVLEPAVRDPRNWSVELPPGARTVVALRKPAPDSTLVLLDPAGSATFRQKVVPLNFAIDKFGEATPTGPGHYDVSSVRVENVALAGNERTSVQDMFARGQYRKMSDQEKLSIPSFEPLDSGIRIAERGVSRGQPLGRDVQYETVIIDSEWESRTDPKRYHPTRDHQIAMLGASAKVRSLIENTGYAKFGPAPNSDPQFQLDDEQYQIVLTDDLSPDGAILSAPTTQGRARDALQAHLAKNPQDRGKYQVVPTHEAVTP